MEIIIRVAEINDAEPVVNLSFQLGYEITKEKTEHQLEELLSNKDNCVFVAVDGGEIIGWIHGFYSIRLESASFVEIGGLVIDEKKRGKGIGKKLIGKVIEWAVTKKCDKLRVRSNTIRKETHAFYKHNGFNERKEQKVFEKKIP